MVSHSIRPDFKDGFLLPYHEALLKCEDGLKFDPAEVVAFAPEDRFVEFSYATEHVPDDTAIAALLSCRAALLRASQLFNFSSEKQEAWIDRELGRLWKRRGPFPGIGPILVATGVSMGHFIAQVLLDKVGEHGNPWEAWESVLANPKANLHPELARHIGSTVAKSWQKMPPERLAVPRTLECIDLTVEQANFIAIPEERHKHAIQLDDSAFVKNPYLFYEATRLTPVPIGLSVVDRGFFPTGFIRAHFPVPEPAGIENAVDARRLRALTIRELEKAALEGHTLRPRSDVISALRQREESTGEQSTQVTADLLAVAEDEHFAGEVHRSEKI